MNLVTAASCRTMSHKQVQKLWEMHFISPATFKSSQLQANCLVLIQDCFFIYSQKKACNRWSNNKVQALLSIYVEDDKQWQLEPATHDEPK